MTGSITCVLSPTTLEFKNFSGSDGTGNDAESTERGEIPGGQIERGETLRRLVRDHDNQAPKGGEESY